MLNVNEYKKNTFTLITLCPNKRIHEIMFLFLKLFLLKLLVNEEQKLRWWKRLGNHLSLILEVARD